MLTCGRHNLLPHETRNTRGLRKRFIHIPLTTRQRIERIKRAASIRTTGYTFMMFAFLLPFFLLLAVPLATASRLRRLDEDYFDDLPPFINEFNNADSINVFVEILSFVNFSFAVYNGDRRQLGTPDYFGDSLYFFNSTGGFIGQIVSDEWRPFRDGKPDSSGNQRGNGRQLADEAQGFTTVTVSPTYLPSNGGIICLEGTDGGQPFYRTTGYGDAIAQIIDTTPCSGKGIDEHVTDSTSLIPGQGESYQRVGEGYRPEDFTWKVLPVTPNNVNVDQEFNFTKPPSNDPPPSTSPSAPVCPEENECSSGRFGRGSFFFGSSPRYNIYKNRRLFGTCSTRCAARFWVRVLRVFGWRCGTCEPS